MAVLRREYSFFANEAKLEGHQRSQWGGFFLERVPDAPKAASTLHCRTVYVMRAFPLIPRFCIMLALAAAQVPAGHAQELETVKQVFERAIPNIPGKNLVALVVNYPPGGKSPAHHHARSAFIYAHVLTGAIRSQVGTEPAKVYQAGEGFHEEPGAHHRVSENASETEDASLLAVFVVDTGDHPLTIPDPSQENRR
jgi:quercetin dioxygenase-like cupin family protein